MKIFRNGLKKIKISVTINELFLIDRDKGQP